MKKRMSITALLVAIVCITGFGLGADAYGDTIISVNFQGTSTYPLGAGDILGAGAYAAGNWNNVIGASGGPITLNDSTGAASTVTLSYSESSIGDAVGGGSEDSTPQELLFGSGIAVNWGSATFEITGLDAFSSYDLVLYYSGGTSWPTERKSRITTSGSATTYYVAGISSVYTAYTQSDHTVNDTTFDPGNYVVYEDLTDASQTASMTMSANAMSLNGFQIIAVPEPATLALMGIGGLLCVVRRRRTQQ